MSAPVEESTLASEAVSAQRGPAGPLCLVDHHRGAQPSGMGPAGLLLCR